MYQKLHPSPATIDVTVAEPGPEEDLLGKTVTDLQQNITGFDTGRLKGESKYIENYEGIPEPSERTGNFLALHFEQAKQGYTVKVGFFGGKQTTLDTDGNYVIKLKDKKPLVAIVEKGTEKGTKQIDISGIKLLSND